MKHVLAGTEYSGSAAAARREEKSLVFGDEVPEDKFTSCKPRGNDPRSLIIQFQCLIIPSILLETPVFVNVSRFFSKNVSAFL